MRVRDSVFFESNPSGAEIWLEGENIGTSAFNWTILPTAREPTMWWQRRSGTRTMRPRLPSSRANGSVSMPCSRRASGSSVIPQSRRQPENRATNVTTIQKSTLKIPTPLGTIRPCGRIAGRSRYCPSGCRFRARLLVIRRR